jgi:hypothetical protein
MLHKMLLEYIVRPEEVKEFEAGLEDHQKAKVEGGASVLERAVRDHNVGACAKVRIDFCGILPGVYDVKLGGGSACECNRCIEKHQQSGMGPGKRLAVEYMQGARRALCSISADSTKAQLTAIGVRQCQL